MVRKWILEREGEGRRGRGSVQQALERGGWWGRQ